MNIQSLIEERPKKRSDLLAWYRELFLAAEAEQISIPQLAARVACSEANLYRWRSKAAISASGEQRLVEARPLPSACSPTAETINVLTPSGHTVAVPSSFDPNSLASIMEVLQQC